MSWKKYLSGKTFVLAPKLTTKPQGLQHAEGGKGIVIGITIIIWLGKNSANTRSATGSTRSFLTQSLATRRRLH